MTFAAVAIGVGTVAAAGIAAATRPSAPDSPDYAAATKAGYEADIATLPRRKEIEAMARLGGTLLKEGYTTKTVAASGEDAQAELARLTADVNSAKTALDKLQEQGAPTDRTSIGSRNAIGSRSLSSYNNQLAAAQARYNNLNQQLLGFQAPKAGEDVTLYFDPSGNPVSAQEAIQADFTGISDIDQSVAAARAQLGFLDEAAQAQLDLQQKYGSQFVQQQLDMLKEADPLGFAIREQMGQKILSEGFGTNLSDAQRAEVEQATRAAQAARGNLFGAAPAAVEAMQTGDAGYRLQQQRLANASAFLSGQTPQAQFGQISSAQQGAVPTNSFSLLTGVSTNPNAGAQGAQFASNMYSTQSQNWATGLNNDPWQSLLGSVTQMGVQGLSSKLFGGTTSTDPYSNYYPNFLTP